MSYDIRVTEVENTFNFNWIGKKRENSQGLVVNMIVGRKSIQDTLLALDWIKHMNKQHKFTFHRDLGETTEVRTFQELEEYVTDKAKSENKKFEEGKSGQRILMVSEIYSKNVLESSDVHSGSRKRK